MSKKIFRAIFFVSTFFLLISFFVISGILYSEFLENEKSYLRTEIKFLKELLSTQDDFLQKFKSDTYRLTLISEYGEVIFDSRANISEMNNLINRKEIEKAIEIGSGESLRYSDSTAIFSLKIFLVHHNWETIVLTATRSWNHC